MRLAMALFLSASLYAQAPTPAAPAQAPGAANQDPDSQAVVERPQSTGEEYWKKRFQDHLQVPRAARAPGMIFNMKTQPPAPRKNICAVPLRNVLRPGPDPDPRMLRKVPKDFGEKFPMREAVPPAPSCDDVR
jgi:hypothetical protein